jgi:hypothetical protein
MIFNIFFSFIMQRRQSDDFMPVMTTWQRGVWVHCHVKYTICVHPKCTHQVIYLPLCPGRRCKLCQTRNCPRYYPSQYVKEHQQSSLVDYLHPRHKRIQHNQSKHRVGHPSRYTRSPDPKCTTAPVNNVIPTMMFWLVIWQVKTLILVKYHN